MKVLSIGIHLNGNFGDDAAGTAFLEELASRPEITEITVMPKIFAGYKVADNNKKIKYYVESTVGNRYTALLKKISNYKKLLKTVDYITIGPCGSSIGIYKDRMLLMYAYLAVKAKKKVVFALDSLNDSKDKKYNKYARKVFEKSKIFVREKASQKYLESIGISSEFGIDSAFNMSDSHHNKNKQKQIIFVPSNFGFHPDFRDFNFEEMMKNRILPCIAKKAKEENCKISILPNFHNLDAEEGIVNKISNFDIDGVHIDLCDNVKTVYDYDNTLNNAEIVVSMRYHGVVLSAKNCTPFIGISYEQKMNEVAGYTGLSDYMIDLKNFDENKFSSMLDKIFENKEQIENKLEQFSKSEIIQTTKLPINYIVNNQ